MGKLFLLAIAFTFSVLIFTFGVDRFLTGLRQEHDFWIDCLPFILIGSGGITVSGVALVKHIIRHIKDALK